MNCHVCQTETYNRAVQVGTTRKGEPVVEEVTFHVHSNLMYCD